MQPFENGQHGSQKQRNLSRWRLRLAAAEIYQINKYAATIAKLAFQLHQAGGCK